VRRADLVRIAGKVAQILGSDDCLLVGGLAVGAHGFVRATRDVDFVTRMALAEARRRLRKGGISATLARGDVLEEDFSFLKGAVGGVRIDVMPPLVPLEWGRGIDLALARGERLRVVDLDGLLRLKLRARGPKDLMDAAALMLLHPELLGRARELAIAYGAVEQLEAWLRDPRLRAEIEETKAAEGLETGGRKGLRPRGPRRRRPRAARAGRA
jgi:hypothetical protein